MHGIFDDNTVYWEWYDIGGRAMSERTLVTKVRK